MRIVFTTVVDKFRLDTVTIDGEQITYTTGRARSIVEGKYRVYGRVVAPRILANWSNGYVSTAQLSES
jgi:hypothetical protein